MTDQHHAGEPPEAGEVVPSTASSIAMPPAMRQASLALAESSATRPPSSPRWSRRRGVMGVVAAVGAFVVAGTCVIGPTGAALAEADPGTGLTLFAAAQDEAQSLVVDPAVDEGAIARDGYTVYVTPKPTPPPVVESSSASEGESDSGGGWAPPSVAPDPGSAQAVAYDMVMANGWGQAEFDCLVALWNKESGWRVNAYNASSGAYGIPQSLPGDKMASAGADWETNPATQISWGLGYIGGRYGSPCGAWGHSQSVGWY